VQLTLNLYRLAILTLFLRVIGTCTSSTCYITGHYWSRTETSVLAGSLKVKVNFESYIADRKATTCI